MAHAGLRCVVDGCRRSGTRCVPLPDADPLDLPVCLDHYVAMLDEPAEWRITSRPGRDRAVAERGPR